MRREINPRPTTGKRKFDVLPAKIEKGGHPHVNQTENQYKSLKKQNKSVFGIVVAVLVLFELCALIILGGKLTSFVGKQSENIFSLTESGGNTNVRIGYIDDNGNIQFPQNSISRNSSNNLLAVSPIRPVNNSSASADESIQGEVSGFTVSDENKVWVANTNVEIFKVSYTNGEGTVTVDGGGEKVIAPGTENKYAFTLQNDSDISLKYTLETEAYFSNSEIQIPVKVRLSNSTNGYLLGNNESLVDVLELNSVNQADLELGAQRYTTYTLDWQWAFDGDDELDTMLGNLSDEEDVSLTIVIRTVATAYDTEEGEPIVPGDDTSIIWWIIAAIVAIVGIRFAFYLKPRPDSL